jgi:hypothetical protein
MFATGAAWRYVGSAGAGRTLVDACQSGDDDERTLAGMFLVQAGDRSVSLLVDAARSAAEPGDLVDVLASIGSDTARTGLSELAASSDARVAAPALSALQDFDEIRRRNA